MQRTQRTQGNKGSKGTREQRAREQGLLLHVGPANLFGRKVVCSGTIITNIARYWFELREELDGEDERRKEGRKAGRGYFLSLPLSSLSFSLVLSRLYLM